MFNLEEKISEWRKQMLTAGIQTPVPLEELENHLREEIERQMRSGVDSQPAFEIAAKQIGQPEPIKAEFKKSSGFLGSLGENRQARINRTFALLWLAYSSWGFFIISAPFARLTDLRGLRPTPDLFLILFCWLVLLFGIIASIRLFGGDNRGIKIIRIIAILGLVAFVAQVFTLNTFSAMAVTLTIFNLASIWLIRPTQNLKPTTE